MLYCFLSNYTEQQFVNGTLELNNIQQVDKDINSCHPADISVIQVSGAFKKCSDVGAQFRN